MSKTITVPLTNRERLRWLNQSEELHGIYSLSKMTMNDFLNHFGSQIDEWVSDEINARMNWYMRN